MNFARNGDIKRASLYRHVGNICFFFFRRAKILIIVRQALKNVRVITVCRTSIRRRGRGGGGGGSVGDELVDVVFGGV